MRAFVIALLAVAAAGCGGHSGSKQQTDPGAVPPVDPPPLYVPWSNLGGAVGSYGATTVYVGSTSWSELSPSIAIAAGNAISFTGGHGTGTATLTGGSDVFTGPMTYGGTTYTVTVTHRSDGALFLSFRFKTTTVALLQLIPVAPV